MWVYLCYECRVLISEGPHGQGLFAFFDPAATGFVTLAKDLFPEDPVIQALRADPLPE